MAGELTDEEFEALLAAGPPIAREPLAESEPIQPISAELGIEPSAPSEGVLRAAPRFAGGIAGGIIGGSTTMGTGTIPGAVAGATIGGLLGQAGSQTAQELAGQEPLEIGPAVKDIVGGGLEQGGGELLGFGAGSVLKRIGGPFRRTVETKVLPALRQLAIRGGLVSPAKFTDSAILDAIHGFAEGAIAGGRGRLIKADQINQEVIERWADEIAERFVTTGSIDEVGEILIKAIGEQDEAYFATAQVLYDRVDDLAGDALVSTKGLKDFARRELERRGKGLPALRSPTGQNLLEQILELDDFVPFSQAQFDRSELIKLSAPIMETRKDIVKGVTKQLSKRYDQAMQEAARGTSSETLDAWRAANKFWKTGRKTFRSKFIRSLLQKDPEKILGSIIKPNNQGLSNIRRLKAAIKGDVQANKAMQSGFIQRMMSDATDPQTGVIVGKRLNAQAKKFGQTTFEEVLTREQIRSLDDFATAAAVSQRTVSTPGKFAIMLAQFGAIMLTRDPTSTAVILIGPAVLAQLLTRKSTARWLTIGLRAPAGSAQALNAVTKISAAMAREGLEAETEQAPSLPTEPVVPLQGPLAPIGPSAQQPF